MTFNIRIDSRKFDTLPLKPFPTQVKQLSWTAFGGPDQALISAFVPAERLLDFTALLRCPLTVSDPTAEPAWWGYINTIVIHYGQVRFTITLDELFNKVKVLYTYLVPDSFTSELNETNFAHDSFSQKEYGVKERVLLRQGIDEDFALALRDTFLKRFSKPRSTLAPALDASALRIDFHCKGWIHSLGWRFYQDLEGFYANHGPGPGQVISGDGSTWGVAQRIFVKKQVNLKYVSFMIRKFGAPTFNTFAWVLPDAPGPVPGSSPLAQSQAVAPSASSSSAYNWIQYTFSPPFPLAANTYYWIVFQPGGSDANNYYHLRIDENSSYHPVSDLFALRFYFGYFNQIPNLTQPGFNPDLYFRVLCSVDSGMLLKDMATATGDFITGVTAFSSGVPTVPYRVGGLTTLEELNALMQLGSANHRLILANVDLNRKLTFYEQPPEDQPTAWMDQAGRFYDQHRVLLPSWRPPIGQYAALAGADHFVPRFDHRRIPAYFVDRFTYRPPTYG